MGLLIRCPTDKAVLLTGFVDDTGVWRYLSQNSDLPGIHVEPRAGAVLHDQFLAAIVSFLKQQNIAHAPNLKLELNHAFEDTIEVPDHEPVTLYLGQVGWDQPVPKTWPTMADLLRGMAKTRARLPYMRALQLLSIGLKDDLTAVETDKLPF